jgi:glucosamine--fructose-6-phosphate aminotransferase (isomerizing)
MLRHALFIVISQSGRSPDLVAATRSARAAGARTIAIVNATSSPVADEAEFVVPIEAGNEHSVAATKTVIGSMAAGAGLVAELAEDRALRIGTRPAVRASAPRTDTRLVRDCL